MNPQLNHLLARQHIADLQGNADRARLASEADARRRGSRDSNPITRLSARISGLTHGLRPKGYEMRTTRRPPRTRDPVLDMSPLTEPAPADVR